MHISVGSIAYCMEYEGRAGRVRNNVPAEKKAQASEGEREEEKSQPVGQWQHQVSLHTDSLRLCSMQKPNCCFKESDSMLQYILRNRIVLLLVVVAVTRTQYGVVRSMYTWLTWIHVYYVATPPS